MARMKEETHAQTAKSKSDILLSANPDERWLWEEYFKTGKTFSEIKIEQTKQKALELTAEYMNGEAGKLAKSEGWDWQLEKMVYNIAYIKAQDILNYNFGYSADLGYDYNYFLANSFQIIKKIKQNDKVILDDIQKEHVRKIRAKHKKNAN